MGLDDRTEGRENLFGGLEEFRLVRILGAEVLDGLFNVLIHNCLYNCLSLFVVIGVS